MVEVLPAAQEPALIRAARALAAGRLVVVPTETVYGLAANAADDAAVTAIFATKGRPAHNPLIVHCADTAAARLFGRFDDRAEALAAAFWPGPLTLVLPRQPDAQLATSVTAGLPTVALRVPRQPDLLALLRRVGRPLAAPSANRSGRLSPTRASDAATELAGAEVVDCVLDGGPCTFGLESTIVAVDPDGVRLLRPGALDVATIEQVVGPLVAGATAGAAEVRAPGMSLRHYAPHLPVRLNAVRPVAGEAWLVFGTPPWAERPGDLDHRVTINLSPDGSIAEAASRLFAAMRDADDPRRFDGIAIAPLPRDGIGEAMHDRLRRAAAASAPTPRWLVLDLGGVVVRIARTWAERVAAAGLDLRPGCDGDAALRGEWDALLALQRGEIALEALASGLSAALHGVYSPAEVAHIYDAQILGPYAGVAEVVARCTVPVAILSNTSAGHWQVLQRDAVVRAARRHFTSFALGLCKPDPAIYRAVAEALEAPAASLLFLDDGQENVDAARAEGWQAETIDPFGDVAAQVSALLGARGLLAPAG